MKNLHENVADYIMTPVKGSISHMGYDEHGDTSRRGHYPAARCNVCGRIDFSGTHLVFVGQTVKLAQMGGVKEMYPGEFATAIAHQSEIDKAARLLEVRK